MSRNTALQTDRQTQEVKIDPAVEASLCANCAHLETCALRTEGSVIQFCEEFEARGKIRRGGFPREVEAPEILDAAEGLCATCAHREECVLRTAIEGGVWYCEEYE